MSPAGLIPMSTLLSIKTLSDNDHTSIVNITKFKQCTHTKCRKLKIFHQHAYIQSYTDSKISPFMSSILNNEDT